MNKIVTLKDYFIRKYGFPIQRIPVDLGLSCPHRGEGGGGCAFCSDDGSRARHLKAGMLLREQVARGVEYVSGRYGAKPPYALYFQAFTATNADAATLRKLYDDVLGMAEFNTVIIATRPDCLPEETVDLIAELNERYDVWVELGVQTANDDTLDLINRGHHFDAVRSAVTRLHERGIKVAAHVILGLPGESSGDYLRTARKLAALPFSGIKVHNLLILKGTRMERMFSDGQVVPMSEYEYANELAAFLRELPEGWIVMRLCADAPEQEIAAPNWWMGKSAFTDMFLKMYESGDVSPDCMKAVRTGDGSYTFYHPKYRQHFHSTAGAWEESEKKYLQPCGVKSRLESGKNASILDVGFGMGFNVCAAVELAESLKGNSRIYITSLEADESAIDAALRLPERKGYGIVRSLKETGKYESRRAYVEILHGDARESVRYLSSHFDYIFLDGFTPDTNPELWTIDFLEKLKDRLKPEGFLASYCGAYPFKGALLKLGFHLYESKPFGRRRGGTVAALDSAPILPPMGEKEILIATKSTAGTPYRDPLLRWSREEILADRVRHVAELRAQGMPKWYKESLSS